MFIRLVKVVLIVLVLHGVWRVGAAYWDHYRFEDSLNEIAQFGGRTSDDQLRARIVQSAAALGLPIEAGAIRIERSQARLSVEANYTRSVLVLPRYPYPWSFKATASVWISP